ncbi:MAG: sulfotransferase, partial [Rhodanobacteraceae bacterium]
NLNHLASALFGLGDHAAAFAAWRRAVEIEPAFAAGWFNLGKNLKAQAWTAEAIAPLERALAIDPGLDSARILLGDALAMLGHIDQAASQYRELLRRHPDAGLAWWGLANLKTVRFDDNDLVQLDALARRAGLGEPDRIAARFALAKALDDANHPGEAFAAYVDANALARHRFAWDPAAFGAWIHEVVAAFDAPASVSPPDPDLGREVLFIVGMPRSGSTLTEQILAAHHEVEGASELPDLGLVLNEESKRRGQPFPHWVRDADMDDWQRLGRRYLERTARWRVGKPRFTDKLPNNWMFVGAIRAMLPGARIVECRRDPVETCFSCFRQLFWDGQQYSYDLQHLAAYWHACDETLRRWHTLYPSALRAQAYEALLAETEAETRALLDFCRLPFDPECLHFQHSARSVRTASAAQVRAPLQRDTARAPRYGALLDPLRAALDKNRIR